MNVNAFAFTFLIAAHDTIFPSRISFSHSECHADKWVRIFPGEFYPFLLSKLNPFSFKALTLNLLAVEMNFQ